MDIRQQMPRNFRERVTSMFSNITLKIIDAGKALFPSIRGKEVNIFKETLEICYNFFTWFFGIIFTLKITDSGKAFYAENHSVMMAVVLIKFVYFLILVLGTLSEMYTRNLYPLIIMLLLESVASLLALSLISLRIMWVALNFWFCIFLLFGYCIRSEIYEMIPERMKSWIQIATQRIA